MLLLVTQSPDLFPGTYTCLPISAEDAGALVRDADAAGDLKSFVGFASTKAAIRSISGVSIELARKVTVPPPKDKDIFLHVRPNKGASGKLTADDLEYFKILFTE